MANFTIPLGATVKLQRSDGTTDTWVFRGTDASGPIFEDSAKTIHRSLGMWVAIEIIAPAVP